jgi:hypothetical protein
VLGLMIIWLFLTSSAFLYRNRNHLSYNSQFSGYEGEGQQLKRLTCNLPDTKLLSYPDDIYAYWFTNLKPASKYIFMYPWVADVGLTNVIQDVGQKNSRVIVLFKDFKIWGTYDANVYMSPLLKYLQTNYHQFNTQEYISPDLYKLCKPAP